jgi:hypothetical protein
MPTARAICARRVIDSSTLPESSIIRSANSSMMMTMYGIGLSSESSPNRLGVLVVEQLVVLIDVADAFGRQQFQPALHLAHGVAQRIGGQLGLGDDGRVQMRHAFVVAQFQPLRIDQNQRT